MKNTALRSSILFLMTAVPSFLLYSCKKGGAAGPPGPPPVPSKCVLTEETTSLVGNEASWKYEYDGQGNPVRVTKTNRYGLTESVTEIGYSSTAVNRDKTTVKTDYERNGSQGDIYNGLPTLAYVSLFTNGNEQHHYYTYFFFYDDKQRLKTSG